MVEQGNNPSLSEILGIKDFPAKQRKAIEIIDTITISPEQKTLLFFYHLWHESGTIAPVKRLTGIKNNSDALSLIGKVLESDELVEHYDSFYKQYRLSYRNDD
jgi:hypothetical protein